MAAGSRHGRGADQVSLRLPEGMRDSLKRIADLNARSMNAEIIDRLEKSLTRWFYIDLPQDLFDKIGRLPAPLLNELEETVTAYAINRVEDTLERHDYSRMNMLHDFNKLLKDLPDSQRAKLEAEFARLLKRAGLDEKDDKEE
ncbi:MULTISPECIES: Arc family DNA-binding protein [Aurantimonas]|uniref:Arc family DNA-binding protein n=1 Tax=Aurantimonas TaxID=182269 RepID=UPI003518B6EF